MLISASELLLGELSLIILIVLHVVSLKNLFLSVFFVNFLEIITTTLSGIPNGN